MAALNSNRRCTFPQYSKSEKWPHWPSNYCMTIIFYLSRGQLGPAFGWTIYEKLFLGLVEWRIYHVWATECWNTPMYSLNRWHSLKAHHWATILRLFNNYLILSQWIIGYNAIDLNLEGSAVVYKLFSKWHLVFGQQQKWLVVVLSWN